MGSACVFVAIAPPMVLPFRDGIDIGVVR